MYPYFLGLFKIFTDLANEFLCIQVSLETTSVGGVITGYISMRILSEIDGMFADSLLKGIDGI
jgi:hypothetical protein